MGTQTEKDVEIFSGFNSTNPDELLKGLMKMFTTIKRATTDGIGDVNDMQYVAAILSTTEFVLATKPELQDRLQVIVNACLDKMSTEYAKYKALNGWMTPILIHHGRLR